MHVVIDVSAARRRRVTGWERFALELFDAVRGLADAEVRTSAAGPTKTSRGRVSHLWLQLRWYLYGLRRSIDPSTDLVHATTFPPPPLPTPTVWTVHDDLVLGGHPEYARGGARVWVPLGKWAASSVSAIATGTQAVADELTALEVPADRVTVIRPGVPRLPSPPTVGPRVMRPYDGEWGPPPSGFVLFVGTLEDRKRPETAAAACRQLGLPIVMVGGRDARFDLNGLAIWPGLHLAGRIDDAELAWLYQHGDALIAPSAYEGLDFPVLEALSLGLPVAASDLPVHREIGGTQCVYFRVGDVGGAAAALKETILRGPGEPAPLPTWRECALGYLNLYRAVLG